MPNTDAVVATFSLVAHDPDTGDLGVVVASKFLAVGAYVPFAKAGVGAVATQSYVNTTFGPRALQILAEGGNPEDCLAAFRQTDDRLSTRQLGIVSPSGASVTFTGDDCHAWAGGQAGDHYAAQGNILAGPEVIGALVDTYLARRDLAFPERLVAALLAGDRAGGDRRGRQSAALVVVGEHKGYAGLNDRWIDLRVDDHPDPIPELQRLLELHRLYLDKPSMRPHELDSGGIRWIQEVLREQHILTDTPTGEWNEATERGLMALYGIENLEERWVGGPKIDPVAWQYLKQLFGGKEK
jgi:uncharacterized Ntn-hydrolase superfamily protein